MTSLDKVLAALEANGWSNIVQAPTTVVITDPDYRPSPNRYGRARIPKVGAPGVAVSARSEVDTPWSPQRPATINLAFTASGAYVPTSVASTGPAWIGNQANLTSILKWIASVGPVNRQGREEARRQREEERAAEKAAEAAEALRVASAKAHEAREDLLLALQDAADLTSTQAIRLVSVIFENNANPVLDRYLDTKGIMRRAEATVSGQRMEADLLGLLR